MSSAIKKMKSMCVPLRGGPPISRTCLVWKTLYFALRRLWKASLTRDNTFLEFFFPFTGQSYV